MKDLATIITECKDGLRPDYDELRYAVLALHSLVYFANQDVKMACMRRTSMDGIQISNTNRYHAALNKSPKEFLGKEYDPDDPEYQKRRDIMRNILHMHT